MSARKAKIQPYLKAVPSEGASMRRFRAPMSDAERQMLEKAYPGGLTTYQLIEELRSRGLKFSEASLRQYIRRGLICRAWRVAGDGMGKHRGSRGVYPCCVVWQVLCVRCLMNRDFTLEDIEQSLAWRHMVSIQGTYPRFYTMLEELREGTYGNSDGVSRDLMIQQDEATRMLIDNLRRLFTLALERVEHEFSAPK